MAFVAWASLLLELAMALGDAALGHVAGCAARRCSRVAGWLSAMRAGRRQERFFVLLVEAQEFYGTATAPPRRVGLAARPSENRRLRQAPRPTGWIRPCSPRSRAPTAVEERASKMRLRTAVPKAWPRRRACHPAGVRPRHTGTLRKIAAETSP